MSQMRGRLLIYSFVSSVFFILWSYVCVCTCLPTLGARACMGLYFFVHLMWVFRCSLGVCKCVGVSGRKRSLHRFEESNQRLAKFSRFLCSSEASLFFFFFFYSLLSCLLSSLITEGLAGGLCSSPSFSMTSFIAVALTTSTCFLIGVFEEAELVKKL